MRGEITVSTMVQNWTIVWTVIQESAAASASAEARAIDIYGGWACVLLSLGRPVGSAPPLFPSSAEGSCDAARRCEHVSEMAVPRRASKSVGTGLKRLARHRLCSGHRTQPSCHNRGSRPQNRADNLVSHRYRRLRG